MNYRIVRWGWINDIEKHDALHSEKARCRKIKHNSYISLLDEYSMTHLSDDIIYPNILDAELAFDVELKELGLITWQELKEKNYHDDLIKSKKEIELFKTDGMNSWFELKNTGYIYFLIKDGKVVYVGQTHTLATKRPYSHKDKSYDKIMVYEVEDKTQLNALETYLIYKLNPFYNTHPGPYGQDKLKSLIMLMEHDKIQ